MKVKDLKKELEKCDDEADLILSFNESDVEYLLGRYGHDRNLYLYKVIPEYTFTANSDVPKNNLVELFGKLSGHRFFKRYNFK